MKRILLPSTKELTRLAAYVDGFLIGIRDMSVTVPLTVTIEELEEISSFCEKEKKELFISLNKNMQEEDLKPLKDILQQLANMHIQGVFFYDIAVVELKQELGLDINLVWSQEHCTTNYATCEFWKEQGVKYTALSSEITLEEIKMICENTDMPLMVTIFGHLPMFVSKRPFITNYSKHFGLEKKGINYSLEKEGYSYPILEDSLGTIIYSSHILNGYQEYQWMENHRIDYILLNSFGIKEDTMKSVLEIFKEQPQNGEEQIESLCEPVDKGFFYKETVYKVKKYD